MLVSLYKIQAYESTRINNTLNRLTNGARRRFCTYIYEFKALDGKRSTGCKSKMRAATAPVHNWIGTIRFTNERHGASTTNVELQTPGKVRRDGGFKLIAIATYIDKSLEGTESGYILSDTICTTWYLSVYVRGMGAHANNFHHLSITSHHIRVSHICDEAVLIS